MAEANDNKGETATLTIGNRVFDLGVVHDTIGDATIIKIGNLFQKAGVMMLDPGYTSTAAYESAITYIDGDKGILLYRGYPIEEIAEKGSYLETAYLLLNGELPTADQLKKFEAEVIKRMPLHDQMIKIMERHRRDAHPMALIGSMVTSLSAFHEGKDVGTPEGRYEVALNLIAKVPTIVAMAHRYTQGLPLVQPSTKLGYVENFMKMCFADADGSYTQNPIIVDAMDKIFTLHADHEQNASTSTVRLAGSTGVEPYAAIGAGIAALWGPAHGGANEAVLNMLDRIGTVENIPAFIEAVKQKGGTDKLMGFGHRVYKNYDPRARIIKTSTDQVLADLGLTSEKLAIAKELERIALSDPYFIERKLYPNVDFYSGTTLSAVGFPTRMFTPLFVLGRTSGWIAQWMEMVSTDKLLIGRPRQRYVGPEQRGYVDMAARGPSGDSARGTLTAADATRKDAKPA